ncbi:glycosyltransferase [Microbacterium keratanolyticum]
MPARVHAILVTRSSATSLARLLKALDAISRQTFAPDALTIVVCGASDAVRQSASVAAVAEGIVETRANTSFAAAVALALPRVPEGSAVWLLTHDTIPEPTALEGLVGALERSPSAAIAAPKLVSSADPDELVSFGQTVTRFGRAVDPVAGELDQGQHDGKDDALGADIRGLLVRAEWRRALRPDPGLGGEDEGLDLGIRARLAGARLAPTAKARIAVSPDSALQPGTAAHAFASRRAQLHRRLAYAPAAAVPLHWLTLIPLALWRSILHLIGKRPAAVAPEWGAAAVAMVNGGAVAQSRRGIREIRKASWASIAPLRVSRAEMRQRLDDGHGAEGAHVQELGFFSGGGAWAVLGALVVSVAAFTSLLAWPSIGGGALLPLRQTVGALWRDAAWGLRGGGVEVVGPADPFAGVLAVLGSLWPGAPSYALVLLWVLALPLAVLGGWFAATRLTDRAGLRIFAAIVWALAPTFLTALTEGRPAAVLVHLLLPWLFHAALVAHRSWGASGAASLIALAVIACAPSLAPALFILWIVAIIVALVHRQFRGAVRLLWLLIPTVVVFAPLVIWQLAEGNVWAIFADPGLIVNLPHAAPDAIGRLALAAGFPTPDLAGWSGMFGAEVAAWALWIAAPLAALALVAPVAPRWTSGILALIVAGLGLATAFAAVGILVSFAHSIPVSIWPGAALSLAWMGAVGAALITLDSAITLPTLRATAAVVAALAIAVGAVPAMTAVARDASALTNGPASTLPAYVQAQARGDRDLGTLVLTPQPAGGIALDVVWGASDTLSGQSTMLSTATSPQGTDISVLAVDLISAREFDAPEELAALGVRFVLLARADDGETDAAREQRLGAITALDRRAGFVRVGETSKGVLWRLEAEPSARADLTATQQATSRVVSGVTLLVLLAALLLAMPTRASRRAARGRPRIVGLGSEVSPASPRVVRSTPMTQEAPAAAPEATESPADADAPQQDAPAPEADTTSEASTPSDAGDDVPGDAAAIDAESAEPQVDSDTAAPDAPDSADVTPDDQPDGDDSKEESR